MMQFGVQSRGPHKTLRWAGFGPWASSLMHVSQHIFTIYLHIYCVLVALFDFLNKKIRNSLAWRIKTNIAH